MRQRQRQTHTHTDIETARESHTERAVKSCQAVVKCVSSICVWSATCDSLEGRQNHAALAMRQPNATSCSVYSLLFNIHTQLKQKLCVHWLPSQYTGSIEDSQAFIHRQVSGLWLKVLLSHNNNNNSNNNDNDSNNHLYFTRVTQSNTGFDFRCGPQEYSCIW